MGCLAGGPPSPPPAWTDPSRHLRPNLPPHRRCEGRAGHHHPQAGRLPPPNRLIIPCIAPKPPAAAAAAAAVAPFAFVPSKPAPLTFAFVVRRSRPARLRGGATEALVRSLPPWPTHMVHHHPSHARRMTSDMQGH
eukprot:356602-Chlamydomonas_euryale.AAC.16